MEYNRDIKRINIKDYDYIVSLGNKCPTAIVLNDLNLYKESFPFDYIPTTPSLILKYLIDQTEFFPKKNTVRTKDDVWFGHFDLNEKYEETLETFKRRFRRLFDALKNKKRILFVYTSEADIYNEMGNRYSDNFGDLCQIADYIKAKYEYDEFKIIAIHVNKSPDDTNQIVNYTINVPDRYLSDNMETHNDETCVEYRNVLTWLLRDIFGLL